MKKKLTAVTLALLLALSLMVSASAASFSSLADDLKNIGVFKGTDSGYELDREASRLEAAVMLVRLLGEEKNAAADFEAGKINHPFTDVPDWADADIAYLYTNKLVSGVSATEFGASAVCSAQMYCTFILRALGYSDKDGADFTYDSSLLFAEQKGLYDKTLLSGKFTRDSLVAISYQALSTETKDGKSNLLSKLITAGTIDAASAKNITDKIGIYDSINASSDKLKGSYDATATMDITMTAGGKTQTISGTTCSMKVNITGTAIEAAIIVTAQDPTTKKTVTVSEWMKDGWLYVDDGTTKSKTQLDYDGMLAAVQQNSAKYGYLPIYCYNSLSATSANGYSTYTASVAPEFLNVAVGAALSSSLGGDLEGLNVQITDLSESIKCDQSGTPKNIGILIDMTMTYPSLGTISASYKYDMVINSVGQTVSISFPSFADFKEAAAG